MAFNLRTKYATTKSITLYLTSLKIKSLVDLLQALEVENFTFFLFKNKLGFFTILNTDLKSLLNWANHIKEIDVR